MKTKLVIWGAGGHGKVAADTASAIGCYDEIVFLDDDPARQGELVLGFPVMGARDELAGMLGPARRRLTIEQMDEAVRSRFRRR